jgi:nitroimidazol reductase NimA-like FMN-containing flavoprotein (pyridoxamine 5'-phosphate oxidase superfamily)
MESMMWTYSSDGRLLMTAGERRPELQVLSSDDCYRLLATQQIGRLGVNAEHYPLILPVNYALDRAGVIVIRTDAGTKLAAANHANVTFEVDEIDQRTRSGWSVLVRALAEEVTSKHRTELIERTKASGVEPWAPGDRGHWMRLIPQAITGRRIVPGELPPPFEPGAYL